MLVNLKFHPHFHQNLINTSNQPHMKKIDMGSWCFTQEVIFFFSRKEGLSIVIVLSSKWARNWVSPVPAISSTSRKISAFVLFHGLDADHHAE